MTVRRKRKENNNRQVFFCFFLFFDELFYLGSVEIELSSCRSAIGPEIIPGFHVPPTVAPVISGVAIHQVLLAAIGRK
jgi:hypothetical protein